MVHAGKMPRSQAAGHTGTPALANRAVREIRTRYHRGTLHPERPRWPMQPPIHGTHHMVSAGHHLATQAGYEILEAGGNAVDAGVAAGIALGIVHSDMVQFAGVAPIMIYLAEEERVVTISGLGWWPRAASIDRFIDEFDGHVPTGILRTVVPAAPDAWILALRRYGTMSFRRRRGCLHPLRTGWVLDAPRDARVPDHARGRLPKLALERGDLPSGRATAEGRGTLRADRSRGLHPAHGGRGDGRRGARGAGGGARRRARRLLPRRPCPGDGPATTRRTAAGSPWRTSPNSSARSKIRWSRGSGRSRSIPAGRGAKGRCSPRW